MAKLMTPIDKLKKAIRLAEEERNMDFNIDSKPITFTFKVDEPEYIDDPRFIKPPLGVKPFWLGIEERQEDLWEAIKRAEHYPEDLINEWSFLDEMKKEWRFRNE